MKYQVQTYALADMQDATKRTVIAEHVGIMNEAEQAAFNTLHTQTALPATEAYAFVPDNHWMFITSDPDPSVTTSVADVLQSGKPEAGPLEGKPVAFEDMIAQILEDNMKHRQAQVEQDAKVREALAQLSSK